MKEQNITSGGEGKWILTWLILAGLVVGVLIGEVLYSVYEGNVPSGILEAFNFLGNTFFMNLLKMVLVPLVASSVVVGVASIGDPSKLGKIGGYTVLYYFATMASAAVLGIILVTTIMPGDPNRDGTGMLGELTEQGEEAFASESEEKRRQIEEKGEAAKSGVAGALWESFKNIANQMIPQNPIGAAAEGKLLPVISFSLIFGIVLMVIGARGQPLLTVFESLFAAIMKLVEWILWLAPVGVLCLVAWTVARIGLASLIGPLGKYMITVLVGLAIHGVIVLPFVLWLLGRTNPIRYANQMRKALMTAFGTDSSSATLPVTLECAVEEGGCSRRTAGFVLPLGATINMDGTALYEAIAVVFLFQAYGIQIGGTELGIIVVTATLAAVGAAGIPSAGLVTMVLVVESVNSSLGGDKTLPLAAVGIILGVDRILDMCRTVVNVWGDAVGAKIISRLDSG